jgi:tetratricopeptide (TPR) repeat protein
LYGAIDDESRRTLLKQLALFHADIAMLHREATEYRLPALSPLPPAVADGARAGVAARIVHWDLGRRILDLLEPRAFDRDILDWYRASAAWLQQWEDYSELEIHLARAREIFPDDAVFCLYLGTMHEALAEPRIQRAIETAAVATQTKASAGSAQSLVDRLDSTDMPGPARPYRVDTPSVERRRAESWFRQALQRDARLHEARIRLGRVLSLRGRPIDGAGELERVLAVPPSELLEYYARLFLGQSLKVQGRLEAAQREFARAAELFPGAQSPRLALSEIARESGDLGRALELLTVLNRRPQAIALDPWHTYHHMHEPSADALVRRLRAWSRR